MGSEMTAKFSDEPRYRYYSADHAHRYAKHVASRSERQMIAAGDTLHGINWRPRAVPSPRPTGRDYITILRDWRKAARRDIGSRQRYGEVLQAVVSPVMLPGVGA